MTDIKGLAATLSIVPSGEYRLIWETYRAVVRQDAWLGGDVHRRAFEQVLTRLVDAGAYVDASLYVLDREFPDAMFRLCNDPAGDGYICSIILHQVPSITSGGATRALALLAAIVAAKDATS